MPAKFLCRHQTGNWGELGAEDKKENDFSVTNDFRILSAYHTKAGVKIWLIMKHDRPAKTPLFSEEY